MFSVDELRVLQRAVSVYLPASKHREADTPHIKRLRRLLEQLVNGEGLIPHSEEMPTGPKPSQEEGMKATLEMLLKPISFAILNIMRSRPPAWTDLDVAIAVPVHAAAFILQNSLPNLVNADRFARMSIQALAQLQLSPTLKEHLEKTVLVGLSNASGGSA
jgi:hypothetical protein